VVYVELTKKTDVPARQAGEGTVSAVGTLLLTKKTLAPAGQAGEGASCAWFMHC